MMLLYVVVFLYVIIQRARTCCCHPVKLLCTCSWLYMRSPLLYVNVSKWEGNTCAFSGAGTLLPPALSLSSDGGGGRLRSSARPHRSLLAASSQTATSPKRLLLRPRPRTSHISLPEEERAKLWGHSLTRASALWGQVDRFSMRKWQLMGLT